MAVAIEAGVVFGPVLILLQLIAGFYLAVWNFAAAVRWKLLLVIALASALMLWLDVALVIKPFFDSWD